MRRKPSRVLAAHRGASRRRRVVIDLNPEHYIAIQDYLDSDEIRRRVEALPNGMIRISGFYRV